MKLLQHKRELNRWTRAELARRARMNASTIGLIEAGRLSPYPVQLRKLARVLRLPLERADDLTADVAPSEEHVAQLQGQRSPARRGAEP